MLTRIKDWLSNNWDVAVMAVLVVVANAHLAGIGTGSGLWAYAPGAIGDGRWLSLLMHPFAHVSAYHLALDAGAFFLLYPLIASRPLPRLSVFTACLLGSMGLAACDPRIGALGFCGLSGIGHGLMAALGLSMARNSRELGQSPWLGWGLFAGACIKAAFEVVSSGVFLAGLHLGDVGIPNTYSHLGGIVGGVAGALCLSVLSRMRTRIRPGSTPSTGPCQGRGRLVEHRVRRRSAPRVWLRGRM